MTRLAKRPRLTIPSPSPESADGFNNANANTNETGEDLQTARARNDSRLKSIFEGIFEKYGRDFGENQDEIDMVTGEIVVNNGHLLGMQGEYDTGGNWVGGENGSDDGDAGGGDGEYYVGDGEGEDDEDGELESEDASGYGVSDGDGGDGESEDDDDDSANPTTEEAPFLSETFNRLWENHRPRNEPTESHWQVPEIPQSTWIRPHPNPATTARTLSTGDGMNNFDARRSPSPPGRSLWAVPRSGRSRKTKTTTDVAKPDKGKKNVNTSAKTSAKKKTPATSTRKPKQTSNPILPTDWSFAELSDGSESDDPLQNDSYQPSPTPNSVLQVRGRRMGLANLGTPVSRMPVHRCSACKRAFINREMYLEHLRTVLADSYGYDGRHDRVFMQRELDAVDKKDLVTGTGTRLKSRSRSKSESVSIDNSADNGPHSPTPKNNPNPKSKATNTTVNHDDNNNTNISATNNTNTPHHHPSPSPTPKTKRWNRSNPDETKLILTMRYVHKKTWREIAEYVHKTVGNLGVWNTHHWTKRRAHPPPLSRGPWSDEERRKLAMLKDQSGFSWEEVKSVFPGRAQPEIEVELVKLWVGEDVWNENGNGEEKPEQVEALGSSEEAYSQDSEAGDLAEAEEPESGAEAGQEEHFEGDGHDESTYDEGLDSPEPWETASDESGALVSEKSTADADDSREALDKVQQIAQLDPYKDNSTAESQPRQWTPRRPTVSVVI